MNAMFSEPLRGLVTRKFTEACASKNVIFSETQLAVLQNSYKAPVSSPPEDPSTTPALLTRTDPAQILSCTSKEAGKRKSIGEQGKASEEAI